MALAFLDTTVINRCHELGVTGNKLYELLVRQGLEPVLGFNTMYELARDFPNTDDPDRTINLFCIVRDLKPKIACKRAKMYIMEFNCLKSCGLIEPFASQNEMDIFYQRIQDYCNGSFSHETFVRGRQAFWDNIRGENWVNEYDLCLMLSETKPEPGRLYLRSVEGKIAYTVITPNGRIVRDISTDLEAPVPFDLAKLVLLKEKILEFSSNEGHTRKKIPRGTSFVEYRDKEISSNLKLRLGLKQMLPSMTDGILNLENEDISLIIDNLDKCPAIRSFIYSQLYQEYKVAIHGDAPAEDKFTDSLQLIEASYCSEYITGDVKHLNYAAWINPSLEYKLVDNLIHNN